LATVKTSGARRWAVAVVVLVIGFLFGFAVNRPTAEATAWLTGITAGLAAVALGVALATAVFAYPDFREFLRRQEEWPDMRLELQVIPAAADAGGSFVTTRFNEPIMVASPEFDVRVILHNAGTGVFRWGILNIQVPVPCDIQPNDDEVKKHYRSTTPGDSGELADGTTIPCNFTVAERDFPPGHHFLYHAHVRTSGRSEWPVAAVLDGYPGPRVWTRAVIKFV
jgi:hypothetical protein